MIPNRQRPRAKRVIRHAFADQVPAVVEAYVSALLMQAERESSEQMVDKILQSIKDSIIVEQLPQRMDFEQAFLSKRAHPAEIKIDEETDSVYLVGVGLPGREELRVERVPVTDHKGQEVGHDLVTRNEVAYDTVLSYTRVSWREHAGALERLSEFPSEIRQGICHYFNLPVMQFDKYVQAVLLACPTLSDDDFYGIAMNGLQQQQQQAAQSPGASNLVMG